MTSKQKIIVLLGAVGFIIVAIYFAAGKLGSPAQNPEARQKASEKYFRSQLGPVISAIKRTGSSDLGRYQLKAKYAGGTSFKNVTLTEEQGSNVKVEYQARTMEVTSKGGQPVIILSSGEEIKYKAGKPTETIAFEQKELPLRSMPKKPG